MPTRKPFGMGERRTTVDAELEIVPREILRADTLEAPLESASAVERMREEPAQPAGMTSGVERWHETLLASPAPASGVASPRWRRSNALIGHEGPASGL